MISWFISLISLVVMFFNQPDVNIYSQTMVVVETTEEYVICVDFSGNEWAFENCTEDWFIGDIASCVMSNNGTDIIYDDEILSAKYCGWLEGAWGCDPDTNEPIVVFEN